MRSYRGDCARRHAARVDDLLREITGLDPLTRVRMELLRDGLEVLAVELDEDAARWTTPGVPL